MVMKSWEPPYVLQVLADTANVVTVSFIIESKFLKFIVNDNNIHRLRTLLEISFYRSLFVEI